ncbi:putative pentatricopeptide repeat-containing protein At3g18840 [Eucalyptus grandis]|uniref:putative pentatricopeptide repeat-containing protein At3g18840 n=1 Tax=Eucalyptus grandis TaxID=71139 RepID=UPI00192EDC3B|nr:putative pentatricopeptide repeat-containing protein At3g18840 [Eucalyptus grandis]
MLTGYVTVEGHESDALEWFDEMQLMRDRLKFDEFTLKAMLNLVAKLRVQCYGTQLHAYIVRTGNDTDKYVMSSLIDMYSKCGSFGEAYRVFCESKAEVDLVSKNTMMAACCREGKMEVALDLFQRLPELNDTVSWNILISGYAQNSFEEESLNFFMKMRDSGFGWNEHTFASVLNACSSMRNSKLGKEIHAWVLREGVISNLFVKSALVDVYCKCGNIKYADLVYATIECENSFSTTSMIVGHSSQGACALQAALDPGKQIHAHSLRKGMEMEEKLISATIDMYFKSGSTEYAGKIFQKLTGRDLILYNIMISGYANHGHEDQAMELYKEMLERGLKPDEVTFIALLSACRHSGLVEMGEKYFKSMVEDYKIVPEMDHYACMIDLYGRANRLEKAMGLMKKIPRNSDPVILGAFLNACKINRNLSLAREAAEQLLVIEEDNGSRYVQLANVFAAEENWAEMRKIREKMRGKETKKLAGCSWVYLENGIHAFTSGDTSHSKAEAIYSILEFLSADLRVLPNSSVGKITTLTLT